MLRKRSLKVWLKESHMNLLEEVLAKIVFRFLQSYGFKDVTVDWRDLLFGLIHWNNVHTWSIVSIHLLAYWGGQGLSLLNIRWLHRVILGSKLTNRPGDASPFFIRILFSYTIGLFFLWFSFFTANHTFYAHWNLYNFILNLIPKKINQSQDNFKEKRPY